MINPINKDDDKCFQYTATRWSNYKETGKKTQDEYQKLNLLQINVIEKILSIWKNYFVKFEKNNPMIAFNLLHLQKEEICQV